MPAGEDSAMGSANPNIVTRTQPGDGRQVSEYTPKRTEVQKESDRQYIGEMSLRGASIRKLVDLVNTRNTSEQRGYTLGQTQVFDDLRWIRAQWQRTAYQTQDEALQAELAKLDKREDAIWQAYEASQAGRRKTIIEGGSIGAGGAVTGGDITKREHTTSVGESRYLALLEGIGKERARLLGLYDLHKIQKPVENADEIEAAQLVATMQPDTLMAIVRAMQDVRYEKTMQAKAEAEGTGPSEP